MNTFWIFACVAGLLVLVFLKVKNDRQNIPAEDELLPNPEEGMMEDVVVEMESVSFHSEISLVSSKEDLLDIAGGWSLEGEDNDLFLAKALEFEDELSEEDWDLIYDAAEEGSKLEAVAEERSPSFDAS